VTPQGRPRCYVASPFGFTDAGRHYYREVFLPALERVVEVVDPWALTSADEIAQARAEGRERAFALTIGERNADAIRTAELIVASLEGQEPDSGTVAEIGFGAALGIPCYALRTDMREAGEPGVRVNLQVESFVALNGGKICSSLEELVDALAAAGGPHPRAVGAADQAK
jgi:nucleoside 2-deoxyribosyltransferase